MIGGSHSGESESGKVMGRDVGSGGKGEEMSGYGDDSGENDGDEDDTG